MNRRWKNWWGVAAVSVLILGLALVGLLSPLPYRGRAASAIGNLCHAPLFAIVSLTMLWAVRRFWPYGLVAPSHRIRAMAIRMGSTMVMVLLGSIAVEAIQDWVGRSASWHDVRSNAWGVVVGCGLHAGIEGPRLMNPTLHWSHRSRLAGLAWSMIAAVVLIGVASIGPLRVLGDIAAIKREFPVLASFESDAELSRWFMRGGVAERSGVGVVHGESSGAFYLRAGDVVGPTLMKMEGDWSSFDELVFDVTLHEKLSDPSGTLLVQIVDAHDDESGDDTFRFATPIHRGEHQTVAIPLSRVRRGPKNRELDLREIRYLDIQLYDTRRDTAMFLDHVRLR